MRVALVHDYIKEYGGAERVLEVLCEIWPDAPIYTAFYKKESEAYGRFKHKRIISSWVQNIPFFGRLASPLRFLTPLIWGSFDLSQYDLIISSASWYVTKGFGSRGPTSPRLRGAIGKPIEICYCHTPPRWLYGYTTSVNYQKYPLVRAYAAIVGHFMRLYDFKQAQKVDYFIANSQEVAGRIKKFYGRDSTVIYPPVSLPNPKSDLSPEGEIRNPKKDYYLIVSRLTGAKGLEIAVEAAQKAGFKLKIAGTQAGYYNEYKKYSDKNKNIQFLGHVSDAELVDLYQNARAFLALAKDEDFGITPVESMLCGTPVIAFNGGGYRESVVNGKTGLLFDDLSVAGLIKAIKQFEGLKINPRDCTEQSQKFSKEMFKREIKEFVSRVTTS